jgi:hypothetical protein
LTPVDVVALACEALAVPEREGAPSAGAPKNSRNGI